MANYMQTRRCDICGEQKECVTITFIPGKGPDDVKQKPYMGVNDVMMEGETYLSCCDECGQEHGTVPRKLWVWAIIGHVLLIAAFVGMVVGSVNKTTSMIGYSSALIGIGWIITLIAGMIIVFKSRIGSGKAGMFFGMFAAFFPGWSLLSLLIRAKKLNRCQRALTALTPVASQRRREAREKDETIAQRMESGAPLTEEEQREIEAHEQEKARTEQAMKASREAQQERARKGNLTYAIIGVVVTVIIGLQGLTAYSSGRGYMQLFHSIDLTAGQFGILIVALLVMDVLAIASALKKK